MIMPKYFTPEALEKFKKELDQLEGVERKKIAEKIKYAASFGDLAENAAYQEAKDSQGFLERKISELKEIISQAKVLNSEQDARYIGRRTARYSEQDARYIGRRTARYKKEDNKIQIGSAVSLLLGNKEKMEIQIVESEEADPFSGKVSHKSSLGAALLGRKKGDKVKVKTSEAAVEYQILAVK